MPSVLVVDDDAIARGFIKDVLSRFYNIEVDEASNIKTAVSLCAKKIYDMIILDQRLPDGDAATYCKTLQLSSSQNLRTPKYIISGATPLNWDEGFWKEFEVLGYMVKPVKVDNLEKIAQLCQHKK